MLKIIEDVKILLTIILYYLGLQKNNGGHQRSPKIIKDCLNLMKIAKGYLRSLKIATDNISASKISEDQQGSTNIEKKTF